MELDPDVWSKLPQDLLESVFARLPPEGVARTRALSKYWNQAASTYSCFTRACAKVQPNLYGIMWFSLSEAMCGRLYDTQSCKWLNALDSKPKLSSDSYVTRMVCDGGLVCLASASHGEIEILPLIVGNPLTRQWRQLPVHRLVKQFIFVQLKVELGGYYSVVIVGYVGRFPESEVVAEVYTSSSNEWRRLQSGLLLGVNESSAKPLVYDCSTGELRDYVPPHTHEGEVLQWKSHLNDLYVLEEVPHSADGMFHEDGYSIAVLKYEDGGSHQGARLPPVVVEDVPGELLFVSGGLVVVVRISFGDERVHFVMFCGGKWHEFDWEVGICPYAEWEHAFCGELRWDARP